MQSVLSIFQIAVPLFLLIAVALILWRSIRIVPQGFNYTTERFGKYTRTLPPGLHILTPLIERVGHKVNMMEQVIDVPRQDVITKDNALVTVDGVAFFQVLNAARASYEITQLQQSMIFLTLTNIRTVMGSMDLDDLLSNRDRINARLLQVVDAATEPWGVKVTRIEIKDIAPPKDIVESMGRQLKAERDKRALILESEGLRQGAILKAEGEKQAVVLAAEGRKEAAFRDAEARERLAQAEAEATRMVSAAVSNGSAQALNYFVANNYVDALKALATSPNQKILMMPLDASSVIGSLAGLAQIAGDAFGPNSGGGGSGGAPRVPVTPAPPSPPAAAPRTALPTELPAASPWNAATGQVPPSGSAT
jgi:regulator of protease activity HflC (stomatin/prohibitin superfamily)